MDLSSNPVSLMSGMPSACSAADSARTAAIWGSYSSEAFWMCSIAAVCLLLARAAAMAGSMGKAFSQRAMRSSGLIGGSRRAIAWAEGGWGLVTAMRLWEDGLDGEEGMAGDGGLVVMV